MDPISLSALIIGIINAVSITVLSIIKVIKHSSCFFGCCNMDTVNDQDDRIVKNEKTRLK